jgi:hypothetical protein
MNYAHVKNPGGQLVENLVNDLQRGERRCLIQRLYVTLHPKETVTLCSANTGTTRIFSDGVYVEV